MEGEQETEKDKAGSGNQPKVGVRGNRIIFYLPRNVICEIDNITFDSISEPSSEI